MLTPGVPLEYDICFFHHPFQAAIRIAGGSLVDLISEFCPCVKVQGYTYFMQTNLSCVYASGPMRPPSLPKPLSLYPPQGNSETRFIC